LCVLAYITPAAGGQYLAFSKVRQSNCQQRPGKETKQGPAAPKKQEA